MGAKIIFKDAIYQYPNRYTMTDLGSGLYELASSPGTVTQEGTLLAAANLNAVADEVIFKLKDTSTSSTTYTADLDGISAYYEGLSIILKTVNSNTTSATLNINAVGAANIKKIDNTGNKVSLVANDLIKNKYSILTYDGTDFVISNPSADLAAMITDITSIEDRLHEDEVLLSAIKSETIKFAVSIGTANTYGCDITNTATLFAGLTINLVPNIDNTGASTINVNSLGIKSILFNGVALTAGMLSNNKICKIIYNGVNWELQPTSSIVAANATIVNSHLADNLYQTATGTGTVITLTIAETLVNGFPITFIASANNSGSATTINSKPLYKPSTTTAPTLIAGKAYTVWYNSAGACFFIKASTTGTVTVDKVLAGGTFSTEVDTDLTGTMVNQGALSYTPSASVQTATAGYHSSISVSAVTVPVAKVLNDTTIAGQTGTMANYKGTDTTASSIDGTYTVGRLYVKPKIGYYEPNNSIIIDEPNFIASNLLSGKSYFGLAGSIPIIANNTAPLNTAYWVPGQAGNTYAKAHMLAPVGYYGSSTWLSVDMADMLANNIVSGKNIFGVIGTATITTLGGKRYASGSGTTNASSQLIVSGLSFQPRIIIMNNAGTIWVLYTPQSTSVIYLLVGTNSCAGSSVNSSGFILATAWASTALSWEAWE